VYAAHKRLVEEKSRFFLEKKPSCPSRTLQPAHLPASRTSSAASGSRAGRSEVARGCPCRGDGVAAKRSHGWRSAGSIERAEGRMPILFGTAVAGPVSSRLAWLGAPHVGAGCSPAQEVRDGSELPTTSRWTFVSALVASTLCMFATLRRAPIRRRRIGRGCACSHSPLEGMGSPSLSSCLNCAAAKPACRSGR
jgi:hypothetical protein